jgi:hypothetical protein
MAARGPGALVETPQKHPKGIPESNPLPPGLVDIHRSDCSYGLFLAGPTGLGVLVREGCLRSVLEFLLPAILWSRLACQMSHAYT